MTERKKTPLYILILIKYINAEECTYISCYSSLFSHIVYVISKSIVVWKM